MSNPLFLIDVKIFTTEIPEVNRSSVKYVKFSYVRHKGFSSVEYYMFILYDIVAERI